MKNIATKPTKHDFTFYMKNIATKPTKHDFTLTKNINEVLITCIL